MIVFATNNEHKLQEVRALTGGNIEVRGLKEIGFEGDIPENESTLEGNSLAKATFVREKYGFDCFADDTGLEVYSLDRRPGVHSARYAGPDGDPEANIRKLLGELEGATDRKARFRTVVTLLLDDEQYSFEGIVEGRILEEKKGTEGFGYDPIFLPDGYEQTFAEMPLDLKNQISHRGRAISKLISFLEHLR